MVHWRSCNMSGNDVIVAPNPPADWQPSRMSVLYHTNTDVRNCLWMETKSVPACLNVPVDKMTGKNDDPNVAEYQTQLW